MSFPQKSKVTTQLHQASSGHAVVWGRTPGHASRRLSTDESASGTNTKTVALRVRVPARSQREKRRRPCRLQRPQRGHARSRLVRKSSVATAIASAMAERMERTNVSQDLVVAELATTSFSAMRTFAESGPYGVILKNSACLGGDASCVAEVSQTGSAGGGSIKIRLHDKVRALELLGSISPCSRCAMTINRKLPHSRSWCLGGSGFTSDASSVLVHDIGGDAVRAAPRRARDALVERFMQ